MSTINPASFTETIFKRLLSVALAALVIFQVGAAAADDKERATVLFKQGVKQFKEQDYEGASSFFRQANALQYSWKLLFNIGQCEAALKRYGMALDAFESYLVQGGDEIPSERQTEVQKEIDRLIRLVGELEVNAPDGCVVFVDGYERGSTPLIGPIRVAAGLRHVEVKQRDAVVHSQKVKITGRSKSRIDVEAESLLGEPVKDETVELEAEEASPSMETQPQAEEGKGSPLAIWGWVLAGTGAAVAIAGGVTGGLALSKYGEVEDACPDGQCTSASDYDKLDQVDTLKLTTDILLPTGAALAVAGVVLLIVGWEDEKQTAFRITPVLGEGYGGLQLGGTF